MPVECCIDTQLGKYALDFLRIDTRPTFIVFVPNEFSADEKAVMLFANDALRGIEKRGELSMGWVLSEAFLRRGGGRCFPTSRWRFTATAVGDSVVKGGIMVVTAEWGGDAWEYEFNQLQREHEREQDEKIEREKKCEANETQSISISVNGIGLRGSMPDTQPAFSKARLSPTPTQTSAVAGLGPDCGPLQPQLPGPVMDWTREDSPLYSSQHYQNLRNVDWYLFRCSLI